jgi:hypothetical protein
VPRLRLRLALTLVLAAGAAFAAVAALAQRQPLPPAGDAAASAAGAQGDVRAGLEGLLLLPGQWVDVHYPADHLDRAARLQLRLDALYETYQPLTRRRMTWSAAAVGRTRWQRLVPEVPWGAAARLDETLFLVPAAGDDATVAAVSALLGGPPPDPGGEPLAGTRAEAGSLRVIDVLQQLEAARAYADAARLRGDEPWIRELLVHLALRYAWEIRERSQVLSHVALFDRIAAAHGGARARRLAEFAPGLPRETDLWFQAQFVRGADAIWVDKGRFGVARLLDRWSDSGKPVRRAELEKKFPALVDWQRAAFAP